MVTMNRIDKMMREAAAAPDVDTASLEDAENIIPVVGVQLNKASRMVTIYQRKTGEPRAMPATTAGITLKKKYKNPTHPEFGKYVFSRTPTVTYHKGQVKCLLHPDQPERGQYDLWNLPVCESAHLASPGEMLRHMETRHPSAWKLLEREREGAQRKAEMDANRALLTAATEAIKLRQEVAPVTAKAPLYQNEPKNTG